MSLPEPSQVTVIVTGTTRLHDPAAAVRTGLIDPQVRVLGRDWRPVLTRALAIARDHAGNGDEAASYELLYDSLIGDEGGDEGDGPAA